MPAIELFSPAGFVISHQQGLLLLLRVHLSVVMGVGAIRSDFFPGCIMPGYLQVLDGREKLRGRGEEGEPASMLGRTECQRCYISQNVDGSVQNQFSSCPWTLLENSCCRITEKVRSPQLWEVFCWNLSSPSVLFKMAQADGTAPGKDRVGHKRTCPIAGELPSGHYQRRSRSC